jgi:hypothetical protein
MIALLPATLPYDVNQSRIQHGQWEYLSGKGETGCRDN